MTLKQELSTHTCQSLQSAPYRQSHTHPQGPVRLSMTLLWSLLAQLKVGFLTSSHPGTSVPVCPHHPPVPGTVLQKQAGSLSTHSRPPRASICKTRNYIPQTP